MSEYNTSGSRNFIELNDPLRFINKLIMMFNVYEFDFIVAFFGFLLLRYWFPNTILGNDQSMKVGFILAFCYALFGFVRSGLLDYKRKIDITSIGSSYY